MGVAMLLSSTTTMTVGASLKPDSASSMPASRAGSGSRRRTEKTAAASVEASTAPRISAVRQSAPSRVCTATATTMTLTPTPSVAIASAVGTDLRTWRQLVVRPPSARINASAQRPSCWASSGSSNSIPSSDSPSSRPKPRNISSAGSPLEWATLTEVMATMTTAAPRSSQMSSCTLAPSRT